MPKAESTKKTGKAGKRSPYNNFMAEELKRLKAADPALDHKTAFKQAAANWKDSPDNPNRGKDPKAAKKKAAASE